MSADVSQGQSNNMDTKCFGFYLIMRIRSGGKVITYSYIMSKQEKVKDLKTDMLQNARLNCK